MTEPLASSGLDPEANVWLARGIEMRPTEIFLAVSMEVAPVWDHQRHIGGFYARLSVPFAGDAIVLDELECDHIHPDRADAWPCAEALAKQVASDVLKAKGA